MLWTRVAQGSELIRGKCVVVRSWRLFIFAFGREGVNWKTERGVDCLERLTSLCLPTCKWPLCLFSWGLDSSQSITGADSFSSSICGGNALEFTFDIWQTRRYWTAGMLVWGTAGVCVGKKRDGGASHLCQEPSSSTHQVGISVSSIGLLKSKSLNADYLCVYGPISFF